VIQLPLRPESPTGPLVHLLLTASEVSPPWSTIGTTTARSDVPEVRNDGLSRGEPHADADSNCFAKCSANRLTASHSV
jgi:hypothetical protein